MLYIYIYIYIYTYIFEFCHMHWLFCGIYQNKKSMALVFNAYFLYNFSIKMFLAQCPMN